MYTTNLSNLESPHLMFSDDEYTQDFNTEIYFEDEILSDYADESYNNRELIMDRLDDDFHNYSEELKLSMDYSSFDLDDFEYDEFGISNDQIMLENASNY